MEEEQELSELEKAACYVQMLKQEGKLDENAIPELLQMYRITNDEAIKLIESFKQTEAYKHSVTNNIKEQMGALFHFLIAGSIFLFIAIGNDENSSWFHVIMYSLAAFGIIQYIVRLLRERFAKDLRFSWISNKALPFLIVFAMAFCFTQYQEPV